MGGMLPRLEDVMTGPVVINALPLGWIVQAVLAAVVQVRRGVESSQRCQGHCYGVDDCKLRPVVHSSLWKRVCTAASCCGQLVPQLPPSPAVCFIT
jgi:hypothetical protein